MYNNSWFRLLILISGCCAADVTGGGSTDWIGDPSICTVNSLVTVSPEVSKSLPQFPTMAQFSVERVSVEKYMNTTKAVMGSIDYLYDYSANKLVIRRTENGLTSVDHFFYNNLTKFTFYKASTCVVTEIPKSIESDGASAILLSNGTWHIRSLDEFLLFSSNDFNSTRKPVYIGSTTIREITVEQWQYCSVEKEQFKTELHTWSFVAANFSVSGNIGVPYAVPVQRVIRTSFMSPDGTQIMAIDDIQNIHTYRTNVIENTALLMPPKGVFCNANYGENLVSLHNASMKWPDQFSMRVEAVTSNSSTLQNFRVRYDLGRDNITRRLRYDLTAVDTGNPQSIILNYDENVTFIIDHSTEACQIIAGVQLPDVNAVLDPIRFFVHNKALFISSPENAWQFKEYRPCRGIGTLCTIFTASISEFPLFFDPNTGNATNRTWTRTTAEYAWTRHLQSDMASTDKATVLDYPASLYLKMIRFEDPNNPSQLNIITEDIEYEFFEMNYDNQISDFDTSLCYRARDWPYVHLGFTLMPMSSTYIDETYFNRRILVRKLRDYLVSEFEITAQRISDIELHYMRSDNSFFILFILLDPIPISNNNQSSINNIWPALKSSIDAGQFAFNIILLDQNQSNIIIQAQPDSLKISDTLAFVYADWLNPNVSYCYNISFTTTTISLCSNQSANSSNNQRQKQEKYTVGSLVGSTVGGFFGGLALGSIILIMIRVCKKGTGKVEPETSQHQNEAFDK